MLEVRLLGPVEVWAGDRQLTIGEPRQRTVLAALAADETHDACGRTGDTVTAWREALGILEELGHANAAGLRSRLAAYGG